jgi:hypothetical protein
MRSIRHCAARVFYGERAGDARDHRERDAGAAAGSLDAPADDCRGRYRRGGGDGGPVISVIVERIIVAPVAVT